MSQGARIGVPDSELPPDVATSYVTNSGTAVPIANVLEILGGAGSTTSAAGNIITVTVSSSGFTWNIVTSAMNPIQLAPENGYIAKGVGVVQFTLPPIAAVGDVYWIKGYSNLWQLSQKAGQTISIGNVTSTAGIGGSIAATMASDALQLLCVTTNTEFQEISVQGNPTIV